jgi:hypothetical protein
MIQALAIWQAVKAFAKRIPWQVWAALAILAAWGIDRTLQYRSGYSEGRESVLAELRTAEAKAKDKALEAIAEAGEAGVERAERFEAEQETLSQAIEKAEAANRNPLDELF